MKIVLVSCASKKLPYKLNIKYSRSLNPDKIFILSSKYGLIKLNEEIEPYNKTLNNMSLKEIKEWSDKVISQLKNATDIKKDEIIFLAGERYRKYLTPHIVNYKIPHLI